MMISFLNFDLLERRIEALSYRCCRLKTPDLDWRCNCFATGSCNIESRSMMGQIGLDGTRWRSLWTLSTQSWVVSQKAAEGDLRRRWLASTKCLQALHNRSPKFTNQTVREKYSALFSKNQFLGDGSRCLSIQCCKGRLNENWFHYGQ